MVVHGTQHLLNKPKVPNRHSFLLRPHLLELGLQLVEDLARMLARLVEGLLEELRSLHLPSWSRFSCFVENVPQHRPLIPTNWRQVLRRPTPLICLPHLGYQGDMM
jgi:hypothetical protein